MIVSTGAVGPLLLARMPSVDASSGSGLRVAVRPFRGDATLQPYTHLLNRSLRDVGVAVEPFGSVRALRSRPDVLHLHWPEHVLRARGLRKVVRSLALLTSVTVARRGGTPLVYTAHNDRPHDVVLSRFDRWFLRSFDRSVDMVLTLTRSGSEELLRARPELAGACRRHTRHGHFRDVVPSPVPAVDARRRLGLDEEAPTIVFIGQVRRYKGVLDVVDAARSLPVTVLIAGRCADPDLRRRLTTKASADPRLHTMLRLLSPDELAAAVSAADLVVLPYRQVLNSGSVFLALSLDRPVLVPDSPTFREIRSEVGAGWVHRYPGARLRSEDIQRALGARPTGRPDLRRHEWSEIAAETRRAYEDARAVAARTTTGRGMRCASSW